MNQRSTLSNSRARTISASIGLAAWIVAPIALIACLTWFSMQQRVAEKSDPLWIAAEPIGGAYSRSATIGISWSEATPVLAPQWSGLVREVFVQPDSVVKSGDMVVQIDAVSRVAWHSAKPFFRSLAQSASGDDVRELNRLLNHLEFSHAPEDRFTSETARGVQELSVFLGAEKTSVFSPDWVVFLPSASVSVDSVVLAVGHSAPTAGEPIFLSSPSASSARLVVPEGGGSMESSINASPHEKLFINSDEYELSDDYLTLTEAAVTNLHENVSSESEQVVGRLVQDLESNSVEVPTAAVHMSPSGTMCVRVRPAGVSQSSATHETTVPVEVLAGLAGRSVLKGDLSAGDSVAVGFWSAGASCE